MTQVRSRQDHERVLGDYLKPKLASLNRDNTALAGLGGVQSKAKFWDWATKNFYIAETRAPIKPFPHQRVIMRLMFEYALDVLHCQTLIYSTIKKCMAYGERVHMTDGTFVTAKSLLDRPSFDVWAYDEQGNRYVKAGAEASYNGIAPCVKITTKTGRTLVRTGNHPLYSWNGWQNAADFRVGQAIGMPRRVPEPENPVNISKDELYFLGYMIGDGSLGGESTPSFSQQENEVLEHMYELGESLDFDLNYSGQYDYRVVGNGVNICRQYGLLGKLSSEHSVPQEVFRCDNEHIACFIAALLDTDGSVYFKGMSGFAVEYCTISPTLAEDFAVLLARFGIYAKIRSKKAKGRYTDVAYTVTITNNQDIVKLAEYVKPRMKALDAAAEWIVDNVSTIRTSEVDTFPKESWYELEAAKNKSGLSWYALGFKSKPVFDTWAPRRELIVGAAVMTNDDNFKSKVLRDVAWDQVAAIEIIGNLPTVAITVPGYENYLAHEISHNSGKTAVGAAVARWAAETWGAYGEVFTLANSLDQAKGRTYAAVIESLELDPRYDRMAREIPGIWRVTDKAAVFIPENSVITPIANSHKGAAGSNPSISVYSELWGYNSAEDKRLWAEMAPSPIRQRSVRFVETYAGYNGESEILQSLYKIVTEEGRRLIRDDVPDWPFEADFAPDPAYNRSDPRAVSQLPFYVNENAGIFAYWDEGESARRMPWQLGERGSSYYRQEAATQTPEEFERLHFNRWTAGVASFIPPEWFEACRLSDQPEFGMPNDESTPIVIAADASVSGDCTGITAQRRHPTSHEQVITCAVKKWQPYKGQPLNYSLTLEPTLRQWITGHIHPRDEHCDDHKYIADLGVCIPQRPHNVVQVTYDQYQLHDLMTRLTMEQIAWCKSFSQNADRMIADKLLYDMIVTRRWHHLGDTDLRDHFMNAARKTEKDSNSKMRIIKKSPESKIDLAVCASMGTFECLRLMI